jgi:hypothetical protein
MTKILLNGRNAAIFLIISLTPCLGLAQSSLRYQTESASNHGILTNDYWAAQRLSSQAFSVIGYLDVSIRSDWAIQEQPVFIERRRVQTFTGNSNALMLAAVDKLDIKTLATNQYPIRAKLDQFEWDALGVAFAGKNNLIEGFSWQLEPKLAKLKQFKSGDGEGTLSIKSDNSSLNGSLHRESNASYGPLLQSKPLEMGYGTSADAMAQLNFQSWVLRLNVKNIWSKFDASGAYASDRSYQVLQSAGDIKFSQIPSVTGVYGQQDRTYKVPAIYKIGLLNEAPFSYGGGVIGFDGQQMTWAQVGYQIGANRFGATTYAFENLAIDYRRDDLFIKGLSVGLIFQTGLSAKPSLQVQTIIYDF